MKARQARKVFKRLSTDYRAIKRYKMTTVAAALSRCTGMHVGPKDAFVACGFAHLIRQGMFDIGPLLQQSNMELAS